jgi:hypothetical protein
MFSYANQLFQTVKGVLLEPLEMKKYITKQSLIKKINQICMPM